MTHLVIELPTTGIELVNGSVIEKLYNLAISGDLDASSNLLGRLNVDGTYLEYIDELEDLFDELYINATNIYIYFLDPVVRRRCSEIWGDSNGNVTTNPSLKLGYMPNEPFARSTLNTAYGSDNCMIHTFDELSLITNLTGLNKSNFFNNLWSMTSIDLSNITSITGGYVFYGCTNLLNLGETSQITSITGVSNFENCYKISEFDLNPSITNIPNNTFKECRALQSIDLSNVTNIGQSAFLGCTSLTSIDLSNATSIGSSAFNGCSLLSTVTFSSSLTSIGSRAFQGTSCSFYDLSNTQITTGAQNMCFGNGDDVNTTVIFPTTFTKISVSFCDGCNQITNLTFVFKASVVVTVTSQSYTSDIYKNNVFYGGIPSGLKIYVPDALVNDYITEWGSNFLSHIFPMSLYNAS